MENENYTEIENDINGIEDVEISDQTEDQTTEVIEITEETEQDTEQSEQSTEDSSLSTEEINQFLVEYILRSSEDSSEGSSEELEESSSESSSQYIPYDDILTGLSDIETSQNDTNNYIETYFESNRLDSDINDISLNNVLLIMLIVVLLFNGLLEFARRIF